MTIYEKPNKDIFAADAPSSEIRPFTAWLRGLGIAFDETNGFPEMLSFNGLLQSLSIYIKYLEQRGLAEWRSDLEYPVGAGVQVGLSWYRAKQQNLNKPPATSQNDWELLVNATALSYVDPLYIENNVVKIRDATTTQRGVARFANESEVHSLAKVNAYINPASASVLAQSTDIGIGQTWQTPSRGVFRTYTNTTSKPILVMIWLKYSTSNISLTIVVDGVAILDVSEYKIGESYHVSFIVPPSATYRVDASGDALRSWAELR